MLLFPLFGLIGDAALGGIISGVGSVIGSGIQALTTPGLRDQRKSKQKYDKWYQENITEKNMALENQYQIDAENRANAYNDPSAVAARMSAAGISPASALGGSASGAGIQSQSDAPSAGGAGGFSPSPMSIRPDFSNLADSVLKGMHQSELDEANRKNIDAQTDLYLKQAGYTEEQRKRMVWEREQYLPELLQGLKVKNATQDQELTVAKVNAFIAEATAEDDVAARSLILTKLRAEAKKLEEDAKFVKQNGKYLAALTQTEDELRNPKKENIEKDTDVKDAQKDFLAADAERARELIKKLGLENEYQEWYNRKVKAHEPTDKTSLWDLIPILYRQLKHGAQKYVGNYDY